MYDFVVVGGGLAGLTAAWKAREKNVLLLEKESRLGGRVYSEQRGPYWLNWGGHVFGGPGSEAFALMAEIDVASGAVPGSVAALAMNGKLLTSGGVETFPFRIPMSWKSRISMIRAGIKVRMAVAEYGKVSASRPGESYRERQQRIYDYRGDESFADFVGPLRDDALALFKPTVTRSAGELHEVSAGAGVGYFQLVWDKDSGLSQTIVGGASTLPEELARRLDDRVVSGAQVTSVQLGDDRVEITYRTVEGGERVVQSRHVVMATPAPITRALVSGLDPELDGALGQIQYGPYVSAAFLTNEAGPAKWDDCYAIATPKRSFNVFFNQSSLVRGTEHARQQGSSIMVFSPADLARNLIDLDDEQILRTYLDDIEELFPGFESTVVESKVQKWPLGLPYNFPGRGKLQPIFTRNYGRLHLAGDFMGSLYTETCIRSGIDAVQEGIDFENEKAASHV